jgi:hypothetical protein
MNFAIVERDYIRQHIYPDFERKLFASTLGRLLPTWMRGVTESEGQR